MTYMAGGLGQLIWTGLPFWNVWYFRMVLVLVLLECPQLFASGRVPGTGPTPLSRWSTLVGFLGSQTTIWEMKTVLWSGATKFPTGSLSGMITTAATTATQFVSKPFNKTSKLYPVRLGYLRAMFCLGSGISRESYLMRNSSWNFPFFLAFRLKVNRTVIEQLWKWPLLTKFHAMVGDEVVPVPIWTSWGENWASPTPSSSCECCPVWFLIVR